MFIFLGHPSWLRISSLVMTISIQEKEKEHPKPRQEAKPTVKLWEYCPFCKLRRKLQQEIQKLRKET